ncbi:MAG: HAMP domain-containing sensor histidine kinase, partial [Anaerolineae bacterium]|nr:HAMP domain-containing sensor histidine kinase [Anaerolineae bacterium]
VAINNARLLQDLEAANKELVHTKTFESIATATGETIHWVGNKAAPIPGCVDRTREDLGRFIYLAVEFLKYTDEEIQNTPLAQLMLEANARLTERFPDLEKAINKLRNKPLKKLRLMLDIDSILEDLEIIEESAETILKIKEDLIGPARRQKIQESDIVDVVRKNIKGFALPPGVVSYSIDGIIPPVSIDPAQIGRVIINLVKNALEAIAEDTPPHIFIAIRQANEAFVTVEIADNGVGIAQDDLDKIWLTFHTSKANKGGTGLGLPACLQIMERMGGKISVTSEEGIGSTFTLSVPIYQRANE